VSGVQPDCSEASDMNPFDPSAETNESSFIRRTRPWVKSLWKRIIVGLVFTIVLLAINARLDNDRVFHGPTAPQEVNSGVPHK
jgi:hypothetical protein